MSAYVRISQFIFATQQAIAGQRTGFLSLSQNGELVTFSTSFSSQTQELNRRTWRVFRENFVAIVGQSKYDWICQRYQKQYSFARLEDLGKPLLPEHIEIFSIGCAQAVFNGGNEGRAFEPPRFTRQEWTKCIDGMQIPFVDREKIGVEEGVSSSFSYFGSIFSSHDPSVLDRRKMTFCSYVKEHGEELSRDAWLEKFSREVVSQELIIGQVFPVSGERGGLDYYRVYRKVSSGHGLMAYALQPCASDSTMPPLIIFRPTQWYLSSEDAVETVLDDFQPHVGELGWKKTSYLLKDLMEDREFRLPEQKIAIAGFSLGGAHAQYFFAEHFSEVKEATFYSNPGVDRETVESAANQINAMDRRQGDPLKIKIFRTVGDVCHYVGEKHMGWGITHPDVQIELIEHSLPCPHLIEGWFARGVGSVNLHTTPVLTCPGAVHERTLNEKGDLDQELDHSQRGMEVWWYEHTRQLWARIAFCAVFIVSEGVKYCLKPFRIRLFRSSVLPSKASRPLA